MDFEIIKINIEGVGHSFEEDVLEKKIKFESKSYSFLKNCVCCWELELGKLYLAEVKCYRSNLESMPKEIDFTKVELVKSYISGLIESDERVENTWDNTEFIVPHGVLHDLYEHSLESSYSLIFHTGQLSSIKKIKLYDDVDWYDEFD